MKRISKRIIGVCLLIFFLLVSLGDFRNLIGPLNYWIVWGVASSVGFFFSEKKIIKSKYIFSFIILSMGFFVSGSWNGDLQTIYQAGKILICGLFSLCILSVLSNSDEDDLLRGIKISLLVTLIIFLYSKYLFLDWLLVLGDGRQGFFISYPGVMWKIGAFGFIYFLCMMVYEKKKWDSIFLIFSAALVAIDGSRTGFLILMVSMVLVFGDIYRKNILKYSVWLIFVLPLVFYVLMILELNSIEILALDRLLAGDSQRLKMLLTAFSLSQECFPVGCGFGAAVAESDEVVEGFMVIHNGYFDALIDGGFLAFVGFTLITIGIASKRMVQVFDGLSMFSFVGVISFSLIMMFHPMSTEMSEWGWLTLVTGALYVRRVKRMYV